MREAEGLGAQVQGLRAEIREEINAAVGRGKRGPDEARLLEELQTVKKEIRGQIEEALAKVSGLSFGNRLRAQTPPGASLPTESAEPPTIEPVPVVLVEPAMSLPPTEDCSVAQTCSTLEKKKARVAELEQFLSRPDDLDKTKQHLFRVELGRLRENLLQELPATAISKSRRIEEIEDILNSAHNMERHKRIELIKEINALKAETASVTQPSTTNPAVAGSEPTPVVIEAVPGEPTEQPPTPKELREKRQKMEEIQDLLDCGIKIEKEKRLRMRKQLMALQEELARHEPASVNFKDPLPSTKLNKLPSPVEIVTLPTPAASPIEIFPLLSTRERREKEAQVQELEETLEGKRLERDRRLKLQKQLQRLKEELAVVQSPVPSLRSPSPPPSVLPKETEESNEVEDIYSIVFEYNEQQKRLAAISALLAGSKLSREERLTLVTELSELQRKVYLGGRQQLVKEFNRKQARVTEIVASLEGSIPLEEDERTCLLEELKEIQEELFLGSFKPQNKNPSSVVVETAPPAPSPELLAKQAQLAELESLLKDHPALSKAKRAVLTREVQQIRMEINSLLTPRDSEAAQKSTARSPQKVVDEVSVKIAELEAVLQSNSGLNRARKFQIQREIDQLRAGKIAASTGETEGKRSSTENGSAVTQNEHSIHTERKMHLRDLSAEKTSSKTGVPDDATSQISSEVQKKMAELESILKDNPQLNKAKKVNIQRELDRLRQSLSTPSISVAQPSDSATKPPAEQQPPPASLSAVSNTVTHVAPKAIANALEMQIKDLEQLLLDNPGLNRMKKGQIERQINSLKSELSAQGSEAHIPIQEYAPALSETKNLVGNEEGNIQTESIVVAETPAISSEQVPERELTTSETSNQNCANKTETQGAPDQSWTQCVSVSSPQPETSFSEPEKTVGVSLLSNQPSESEPLSADTLAKITELEAIIRDNPTLNRPKKAKIQREIDELRATKRNQEVSFQGSEEPSPILPQQIPEIEKPSLPADCAVATAQPPRSLEEETARTRKIAEIKSILRDAPEMNKSKRGQLTRELARLEG